MTGVAPRFPLTPPCVLFCARRFKHFPLNFPNRRCRGPRSTRRWRGPRHMDTLEHRPRWSEPRISCPTFPHSSSGSRLYPEPVEPLGHRIFRRNAFHRLSFGLKIREIRRRPGRKASQASSPRRTSRCPRTPVRRTRRRWVCRWSWRWRGRLRPWRRCRSW